MIRVRLVTAGKLAALARFFSVFGVLGGYLVLRNKPREPERPAQKLVGRVVAVFSNTHYAHEVEGRVRFLLTAGIDKTYEDGTHELEQVRLESRGATGDRHDIVSADRAKVSDPSDLNRLDAEFIDNVVLETSDGLAVKTSYLHYDYSRGIVDTEKLVTFERGDLSGRTTGALIEATEERVHMLKDVDLTIKPHTASSGKLEARPAGAETGQTSEERSARKARKRARKLEARARRASRQPHPTSPDSGQNSGDKAGVAQGASGKRAPSTRLVARKPTHIQSQSALLEKKDRRVTFNGRVVVTQGADQMLSDRMVGFIGDTNKIERIEARGNAHLTQAGRLEIKSSDMDFFLGDAQQLVRALATGDVQVRSLGPAPLREASAASIEALFIDGERGGTIDVLKAEGHALLRVHAPEQSDPKINPTTRELAAGFISMHFFPDGKNLQSAEATDSAVLSVIPVRAEANSDRKILRAPRMSALFFEDGNRLKSYEASGGVRVEIEAMVKDEHAHAPRVTTSQKLTGEFGPDAQDLERLTQEGNFKFNEADRIATADRAVYDRSREVLLLRGERPTVADSKGRTQADEIDYDRQRDETHARGDVRTTYYSPEQTNDSTPFKNTKSPVFVTADRADASNKQRAVFNGNARGWQDDNFIKADRIELYQEEKRMVAIGNVDSALYSVDRKGESDKGQSDKRQSEKGESEKGESDKGREMVPGFASAERMTYSDADRRVHYVGGVRARQGSDRIEADSVEVFLMKETKEVERLTAEGNVVLNQPGRRGTGDKLVYTGADGRAILEGKTARVEDDEKGVTMGAQLTFYSRDDKVFVDNRQGTGRVRSVHRLGKGKAK